MVITLGAGELATGVRIESAGCDAVTLGNCTNGGFVGGIHDWSLGSEGVEAGRMLLVIGMAAI